MEDTIYIPVMEIHDRVERLERAGKIKELRESVGRTREAFASYTGIPLSSIENWESGRKTVPTDILHMLYYRIQYDILLGRKPSVWNKPLRQRVDVFAKPLFMYFV